MKLPGFVCARYDEYEKKYEYSVWAVDMSNGSCGYVLVEQIEVDFTPPPHEVMVKGTIETYRAQQQKIRAEAESKVNRLQQAIDDLLCLEYKPEQTA